MREKVIDMILRKAVFSNGVSVILSFVAREDDSGAFASWAVATKNTSIQPVKFFNNYEAAEIEMQTRCGVLALSGHTVEENADYGVIKGHFKKAISDNPAIKRSGYRVMKKVDEPSKAKTLKIENKEYDPSLCP